MRMFFPRTTHHPHFKILQMYPTLISKFVHGNSTPNINLILSELHSKQHFHKLTLAKTLEGRLHYKGGWVGVNNNNQPYLCFFNSLLSCANPYGCG